MTVQPLRPAAKPPAGYRMLNKSNDVGEIFLYAPIGASFWGDGISADQFRKDLKALGAVKTIELRINSEGGDVFDAKAMYTLLQEHQARINVHVDGLAASAASFVAMSGDEIAIADGAFMMIHNSHGLVIGGATQMRDMAQLLDVVDGTIADIYVARTKQPRDKIVGWMNAETWMTGKEAVTNGFANLLVENKQVAASVRKPDMYKHLPAPLRPRRAAALARLIGVPVGAGDCLPCGRSPA